MRLPLFTLANYTEIMKKDYSESQIWNWIEFKKIISMMDEDFVNMFAWLDARKIWNPAEFNKYTDGMETKVNIWLENPVDFNDFLISLKLWLPSLWTCDYFFRNVWSGLHHGIDIILPKWTPLPSFVDWVVVRVKSWDWYTKNEWNCVVVKWEVEWEDFFVCYEHMDSIAVSVWDKLKQWDIVWECWTTWNSTQYHLHLQIDKASAPFHPFYSSSRNLNEIKTHTYNTIEALRRIYNIDNNLDLDDIDNIVDLDDSTDNNDHKIDESSTDSGNESEVFADMPLQEEYRLSIKWLYEMGVIKWNNWYIYSENEISRYEFALMIYRLIIAENMENWLSDWWEIKQFDDVDYNDSELKIALDFLQKYNVFIWSWNKFYPDVKLLWEELLAVVWRLFYQINDIDWTDWYKGYFDKFSEIWIIDDDWMYIWNNVPRKEVFRLIYNTLN